MKKLSAVFLCACLALSLLTSCGGSSGASEQGQTAETGILNVAIISGDDRFAGYVDGTLTGIEIELANGMARTMGVTPQLTVIEDVNEFFTGVSNGRFDIGFGRIPETDPRNSGLTVSRTYGRGSVFIVAPKFEYMNGLEQISGAKVGLSFSVEPLADRIRGIEQVERESFTDMEGLSAAVMSGAVRAALVNEREAMSLISDNLQAQELYASPTETYVAIMPANSKLKGAVDEAISQYYNALIGLDQGSGAEEEEQGEQEEQKEQ